MKGPAELTQAHVKKLREGRTGIWINPNFKPPTNPDWELMRAGRFEEAAEAFLSNARSTNLPAHYRNRALAFVSLGRYRDAYVAFEEADKLERSRKFVSHRDLAQMGLCLWLAGDRQAALPLILENLDLRMRRQLTHGDAAGGASEGLIAYYVGVSLPDARARAKALKHLKKVAGWKRGSRWPGPIAKFLVGKASFEDVLLEASEARDLETAISHARVDTLAARQLAKTLFYTAVKSRDAGQEEKCMTLMRTISSLPLVHIAFECYLARHEVGLSPVGATTS